jgi:hypothetical protein
MSPHGSLATAGGGKLTKRSPSAALEHMETRLTRLEEATTHLSEKMERERDVVDLLLSWPST